MAPDVVSLYEISKRRWITQPFKKMRFAGIRYFIIIYAYCFLLRQNCCNIITTVFQPDLV